MRNYIVRHRIIETTLPGELVRTYGIIGNTYNVGINKLKCKAKALGRY